ncbi:MAG: galactosyldiacylglycerol synthase [Calditrichaeota bacterium]|nr:MAG: galactosyldiacylglycerol synthase [Calditrichota bacterium]
MISIYEKETGKKLGQLSEKQLHFLMDHLEEESSTDQDYYINTATVDMMAEAGADEELLRMLRNALGKSGEAEIYWSEE